MGGTKKLYLQGSAVSPRPHHRTTVGRCGPAAPILQERFTAKPQRSQRDAEGERVIGYLLEFIGKSKKLIHQRSTIYDLQSLSASLRDLRIFAVNHLFSFDFSMLDVHSTIYTTLKTLIAVAFLIIFLPCFFTAEMVTV